ncbi:hypothetical protein FQR65_LT18043 [Abscondita terminalis]|nr:hypothetical protein FQR65_LT18043 [Abscondita terminalis]
MPPPASTFDMDDRTTLSILPIPRMATAVSRDLYAAIRAERGNPRIVRKLSADPVSSDLSCRLYDASLMGDDIPYAAGCASGQLVEFASHWGLDDWPQYVQSMVLDYMMPIRAPEQGFAIFAQEFEAAYRHGALPPPGVPVLHPFANGACTLDVVHRFLEQVLQQEMSWFAPMERSPRIRARSSTRIVDGQESINCPLTDPTEFVTSGKSRFSEKGQVSKASLSRFHSMSLLGAVRKCLRSVMRR